MKTTREFTMEPAYDKRSDDPKKNYGIHGVTMRMVVKGQHGAVQFIVYTNWHLKHVQEELDGKHHDHLSCHPLPADVGYHSKVPMYEVATVVSNNCEYTGGECYYDGSGLRAYNWYDILVSQGSEAVWKLLEEEYELRFKDIEPCGGGI